MAIVCCQTCDTLRIYTRDSPLTTGVHISSHCALLPWWLFETLPLTMCIEVIVIYTAVCKSLLRSANRLTSELWCHFGVKYDGPSHLGTSLSAWIPAQCEVKVQRWVVSRMTLVTSISQTVVYIICYTVLYILYIFCTQSQPLAMHAWCNTIAWKYNRIASELVHNAWNVVTHTHPLHTSNNSNTVIVFIRLWDTV